MGGSHSRCRTCPDCGEENCNECASGESRQECPTNPFTAEECDFGILNDKHRVLMTAQMKDYERQKEEKEQEQAKLEETIDTLKVQKKSNKTSISALKTSLHTNTEDYSNGLDHCKNVTIPNAKRIAESCESSTRKPALQQRNDWCIQLRNSLDTRNTAQKNGWAQCQCPNGTLLDTHLICNPGQTSCSSCDANYWLKPLGTYNTCDPVTQCGEGEYEHAPPTGTRDRDCRVKQCRCDNGRGPTGTNCPEHGMRKCQYCTEFQSEGHHKPTSVSIETTLGCITDVQDTKVCQTNCDNDSSCVYIAISAVNNDNKRECCYYSRMQFDPNTDDKNWEVYKKQDTGYDLNADNTACVTRVCKCAGGTPARGLLCPKAGAEMCSSCNDGFYFRRDDSCSVGGACGTCHLKQCKCENGTGLTGVECPEHGAHGCKSCIWEGNRKFMLEATTNDRESQPRPPHPTLPVGTKWCMSMHQYESWKY